MEAVRLYEKYRPKMLEEIAGKANKSIVTSLQNSFRDKKLPHAILFKGETGSGKTTIARILALMIHGNIEENLQWGVNEYNMSDKTGIDAVREIGDISRSTSMAGDRVIILDEVHRISAQAQDALLKYLEDIPSHLYWILCTDSPDKLDKALVGRCSEFNLKPLSKDELTTLLLQIQGKEGKNISQDVIEYIASISHNNRKAIQNLETVLSMDSIDLESVKLLVREDHSEDNNWFRLLVQPFIWPFMFKDEDVFSPEVYLPKLAECIEKDGAIALALSISGYCRNRILSCKFMVTAKGEKKSSNQYMTEYQKLYIIVRHFSRVNYAEQMKPENNFLADFIDMVTALKKHNLDSSSR